MQSARTCSIMTLLLSALALCSCGRMSLTFTFGGDPSKLEETTVIGKGEDGPKVALIDVRGLIVNSDRTSFFMPSTNPVDDLVAHLDRAAADPDVRAVVLRINSPGGAVTASDTMYREVERFRASTHKPVVVSMSEVAASGGYYLALAGDEIIAQPTTITGSIGVIIPTLNFSDGLRRIGIISRSVKSGPNKDIANPLEPMRETQYEVLQGLVDQMYARFRALVLERRGEHGLPAGRADEIMDGRVFTGEEARTLGLVDTLGDLRDSFDRARARAGIGRARLIMYHAEGETPRTAYATSSAPRPSAGGGDTAGGTEINLVQLNLGQGAATLHAGTAYYLWAPEAP